jgi:1-acyl-sn-glycerol-3-phosphate acyltransferase
MGQDDRARRALELLAAHASDGSGELDPSTPLADLGLDSLSFAEVALALEEELGVTLEAPLDGSATVGELLEALERAGPSPGAAWAPDEMGRLQGAADLLLGLPMRWWLDLHVEGAERVPERGPAILAINHESALDIPVVVIACPRRLTYMAKRELYKGPVVSWSLQRLGAFPVDRARYDVEAIRLGLAVLARGGVLGMYPEGTRNPGELLPFLPGAAWMAIRTGAPLVPVSLLGTERAGEARRPRAVRVQVRFGRPIRAERVDDPRERVHRAAELTLQLREAVEAGLRA